MGGRVFRFVRKALPEAPAHEHDWHPVSAAYSGNAVDAGPNPCG